jgi:signal transduction histidine kinase
VGVETRNRPVLRSRAWPVAGGALTALAAVAATFGVDSPVGALVVLLAMAATAAAVLAWALVRARRERRRYEDALMTWAAERAAQAERLRIARDLHDLASHGLGLITVRAASARTVRGPGGDAERARALADVERAGREATTELRRMLSLLRTTGEPSGHGAALRPAETLDDLPRVVAEARSAGLDVGYEATDLPSAPGSTGQAACTVAREALANVLRHAGPTRARVVLSRERGDLRLVVDDDGPVAGWRPHPGAGLGLVGLHERVAALGGTIESGPAARGYRVVATWPSEGA